MCRVCAILCLASAHASVLSAPAEPPLTPENINPRLVAAEYAVRGRLLDRAKELESAGRQTVKCNIGNPQALGEQISALVAHERTPQRARRRRHLLLAVTCTCM